MFNLKDKVCIVTGANTGLGQAICVEYAKLGAKVVGVSRRSSIETKNLIDEFNGEFYEINQDVSKLDELDKIIELAVAKYKTVDVLVNNAGVIKRLDSIDVSIDDYNSVIEINQTAVFLLSQAFAKEIIKQNKKGKIINIASMLSYQGGYRVISYAASKHAVVGMTKALCNEWAKYNINVNAIAPGYMETNNTKDLRNDEARNSEILSRIPMNRYGTSKDIAGAAIFLASQASDYVNGFTLAVDGGWLAR